MQKWEYKLVVFTDKFFEEDFYGKSEINKLGEQGWEFVTIVSKSGGPFGSCPYVLLKRPKT